MSTATTWGPAPTAYSISVAVGDNDTMRCGDDVVEAAGWDDDPQPATARPARATVASNLRNMGSSCRSRERSLDDRWPADRTGLLPRELVRFRDPRRPGSPGRWCVAGLTVAGQRRIHTGFADVSVAAETLLRGGPHE